MIIFVQDKESEKNGKVKRKTVDEGSSEWRPENCI